MRSVPFEFVLEELESLNPTTKPMFGCLAVYVGPKIVMILREKTDFTADNGIWIATTREHHASLKEDLPSLVSITIFSANSSWRNLPSSASDFEESALKACDLIRRGDLRIGTVPKRKGPVAKKAKARRHLAKKAQSREVLAKKESRSEKKSVGSKKMTSKRSVGSAPRKRSKKR